MCTYLSTLDIHGNSYHCFINNIKYVMTLLNGICLLQYLHSFLENLREEGVFYDIRI